MDITIYKFTSSTCGPCRMLGPIWKKVTEDPTFANINFKEIILDKTENANDIFSKYNVRSVPTIIVTVDNDVKETMLGVKNVKILTDTFKKYV